MLFFCLGLCKRWLEGGGQGVPRGQQVRRELLCPGAGEHSCDRGLYSLLLRQLLQVMVLIYMTGGEGSNVGESWLTGQKPKPAGKRRGAVEETAEGSCCAGGVAGARGAGSSLSPHASPCRRPVAPHLALRSTDFIEFTETSSTSKDKVGAVPPLLVTQIKGVTRVCSTFFQARAPHGYIFKSFFFFYKKCFI